MSVAHETAREPKPQEPQQSSHWREMGFGAPEVPCVMRNCSNLQLTVVKLVNMKRQ